MCYTNFMGEKFVHKHILLNVFKQFRYKISRFSKKDVDGILKSIIIIRNNCLNLCVCTGNS